MEDKKQEFLARGTKLVHASQKEKWEKCVADRIDGVYKGKDIEAALEIMEAMDKGADFAKVSDLLNAQQHSGASHGSVLKIIANFAKQGPKIYEKLNEGGLSPETIKQLKFISDRNEMEAELVNKVGAILHGEFIDKNCPKLENGSYTERWRPIKARDTEYINALDAENLPTYIRKAENGYEIDIANCGWDNLNPAFRESNQKTAETAVGCVIREKVDGEKLSLQQVGTEVHNTWMELNSWDKENRPHQFVPFAELSKEEQDKDLDPYYSAHNQYTKLKSIDDVKRMLEDNNDISDR